MSGSETLAWQTGEGQEEPAPEPSVALLAPVSTYRAAAFMAAARRLGLSVILVSDAAQTLASYMNPPPLAVDFSEPPAVAEALANSPYAEHISAVVALDDQATQAAAAASARLGCRGNPPAAVAATRDKSLTRARLDAAGVRQPTWRSARSLTEATARAAEIGYPIVVKPTDRSGSQGVIRVNSPAELPGAFGSLQRILRRNCGPQGSAAETVLVEQYIDGTEVAVDGLVTDGRLEILAIFDKPAPLTGPYFEETIYTTPSELALPERLSVAETAAAAVAAVGLQHGPVHIELRLADQKAYLIELAARSIGGRCAKMLEFHSKHQTYSLEEVILLHAMGRDLRDLRQSDQPTGVMMLPIRQAGRLRAVTGESEALGVPGITAVEITLPIGSALVPLPEGDRYLGFAFARGPNPGAVAESLRQAADRLGIVVDEERSR